ncbi:hypothetical protein TPHA_0C01510 [Tetrapisispora phaffii CBS 4417]|uniref:HMG box domain-containing protein n=1 Tax=Tetrapisispora phaffii (strain ATCC 24235 / CBS 4417 / NBRC 1672 / NRRL Y-8282 / UCD 70-5) TaxID=1071381 RepID=G8BRD1_TETPH|nr:hypothetical protein TPHA_0C01510 [Tetrapisispora phaffii CBS 4417]CCE62307.1 hypothetical protein TPHA_0C01510 [Tetrapisispora phaffii CBS 4417]
METNMNLPPIRDLLFTTTEPLTSFTERQTSNPTLQQNGIHHQMAYSSNYGMSPRYLNPSYNSTLMDPTYKILIPPLTSPEIHAFNPSSTPFVRSYSSLSSGFSEASLLKLRQSSISGQANIKKDYVTTKQTYEMEPLSIQRPLIKSSMEFSSFPNKNEGLPSPLLDNSQLSVKLETPLVESPKKSDTLNKSNQLDHLNSVLLKRCRCRNYTKAGKHIPRPRNAFILFRQQMHGEMFGKYKNLLVSHGSFKTNSIISKEIGQKWRALSDKEKERWHELAKKEKEEHKLKYTDYKYIPRRTETFKNATITENFPSVEFNNYKNKIKSKVDELGNIKTNDNDKGRDRKLEEGRELCEYCTLRKKDLVSNNNINASKKKKVIKKSQIKEVKTIEEIQA